MSDYSHARRVMVDNQIRTFDVTDRAVLAAFDHTPRDVFVAPADRPLAYSDARLIVQGERAARPLLQPMVLARLLQALRPQQGERALDCFGGLGYSAALLAALATSAIMVESDAVLVSGAKAALAGAAPGVQVLPPSDLTADDASALGDEVYDVILMNGAVDREPTALLSLLADGGRLGVIFRAGKVAKARIYLRSGDAVAHRDAFEAQGLVLPGFSPQPSFVF
ncbi:Pcm Protein-L-isoaspartate carboxylmethyltransferase [Rhabdaerophilaceae bacterium]